MRNFQVVAVLLALLIGPVAANAATKTQLEEVQSRPDAWGDLRGSSALDAAIAVATRCACPTGSEECAEKIRVEVSYLPYDQMVTQAHGWFAKCGLDQAHFDAAVQRAESPAQYIRKEAASKDQGSNIALILCIGHHGTPPVEVALPPVGAPPPKEPDVMVALPEDCRFVAHGMLDTSNRSNECFNPHGMMHDSEDGWFFGGIGTWGWAID